MDTVTLTTPGHAVDHEDASQYVRIINVIRNMSDCGYSKDSKVVVPIRTISNPSPLKRSASNRHPGQTHTRAEVDEAIAHELAQARYLMQDLADHVLGHIVSTALARDILCELVKDGIVQIFEGTGPGARNHNGSKVLRADSSDVEVAIQQAFEDADRHDCIKADIDCNREDAGCPFTDTNGKGKQKAKSKKYSFRWVTFPAEPLGEDELVSFLNDITDRAFRFAEPRLTVVNPRLRHRFAAPEDKHHAVPLSYEPDGEDMRPDFLLLPIEAFDESDGYKTVDARYINFTASRLVGESKNKDLAASIDQIQWYARGLKRAQPWIYYVLGMTITKDKAVFLRGEGSGTERLDVMLSDGRGCIEFIRILLGLALADKVDLGQNPDVVLGKREQPCIANNVGHHSAAFRVQHASQVQAYSVPNRLPQVAISKAGSKAQSASAVAFRRTVPSSTFSKRAYSEISDGGDEGMEPKRHRTDKKAPKEVHRFIFFPLALYDYECLGILFTACSIRGRGTTVFCVVNFEKYPKKRLALKMAWQDLGRVAEQDAVMAHLMSKETHPNVIVPLKAFKVERNGKSCDTLGVIRGFSDEQIGKLGVENRVLTVSVSELKRPVKYFWGVHDFVRGLRGALLGHEYLTTIGILHRDISENNIVLGLRPGDERGYLIDLDMATLQEAEDPTPDSPAKSRAPLFLREIVAASPAPHLPSNTLPRTARGLRTGTFPYISYNVLRGGRHTHFDDVESFLYVLLLFFFSYAGPLSDAELCQADEIGFVQPIGSGRPSHTRNWPKRYAKWADGDPDNAANHKLAVITTENGATEIIESYEFVHCLENNWPRDLHTPISNLIEGCFTTFWNSTSRTRTKDSRTEVSHAEFIRILDAWLNMYSYLEDQFSNCPFDKASKTESS